jgi:hypothetical protein
VICVASYAAAAAFIRDARDNGLDAPIANLSFSDSDNMLKLLQAAEVQTGRQYTHDLVHSQVVPSYEDTTLPAVRLYRDIFGAYQGMPPEKLLREPYTPHRYSFVSLEGFLSARLLTEVVSRLGLQAISQKIPETMESVRDLDLGLGEAVSFSPERNQGLNRVYYTTIEDGRCVPLRDWSRWSK